MRSTVDLWQWRAALLFLVSQISVSSAMVAGMPAVGTAPAGAPSFNIGGKCVYFVRHGQVSHHPLSRAPNPVPRLETCTERLLSKILLPSSRSPMTDHAGGAQHLI